LKVLVAEVERHWNRPYNWTKFD